MTNEYVEGEPCKICGKPNPPIWASPFSDECDAGRKVFLKNGKTHPGFCDSKRLGLKWPPDGAL